MSRMYRTLYQSPQWYDGTTQSGSEAIVTITASTNVGRLGWGLGVGAHGRIKPWISHQSSTEYFNFKKYISPSSMIH